MHLHKGPRGGQKLPLKGWAEGKFRRPFPFMRLQRFGVKFCPPGWPLYHSMADYSIILLRSVWVMYHFTYLIRLPAVLKCFT